MEQYDNSVNKRLTQEYLTWSESSSNFNDYLCTYFGKNTLSLIRGYTIMLPTTI